jgi:hypothetical protein
VLLVTVLADPWQDFLKLFEIKPEEAQAAVAEIVGGAIVNGAVKGFDEGYYDTTPGLAGTFPYLPMPVLPNKLPPLDDLLVALAGPVVSGLAALAGNRDAFRVGLGLSAFGIPNWLRVLIIRCIQDPPTIASSFESMGPPGAMRTYA